MICRKLLCACCIFSWLSVATARAATYHVEQRLAWADDAGDGSEAHPWKTISRAAENARAGDLVLIGDGVYREAVKIARNGSPQLPIRFEAAPGASVLITGADRITHWTPDPVNLHLFSTSWGYNFIGWNPTHTHPGDDFHLLIGRSEQVFVGGQLLRQVLDRQQLARGTFYVDLPGKRLYAWSADNAKLSDNDLIVEASTRSDLWECTGDYVQTHGLHFRYAANMAQHGAANFAGNHDVVEDCTFERMNSSGATFAGQDLVVRHCKFADNGQLGFGAARAHRMAMSDCEIARNNIKGFSRGWEAGGDKIVLSRAVTIEHCIFQDNHGTGIWFDIGNEDCTVKNCLIADNEDAGLFDEISYGLHVTDCVIIGNGLADSPGAWGAAGGICLSSSPGSFIARNLLVGNKEGFSFREQDRTTPRIDAAEKSPEEKIWNHDEQIRHNIFAYNRDAQLRGWFDMNDQRMWPAAMREKQSAGAAGAMSLETLKLDLSDNVYAVRAGESIFKWGVPWKRHKDYESLEGVRKELGLEEGSEIVAILFQNIAERDFRLPAEQLTDMNLSYPHSQVPGVRLGVVRKE